MRNLAPDIVRQRLMIEAFYDKSGTKQLVKDYLLELAAKLDLRVYGEPVIFEPASGMGKDENAGFDAFVPLIDSGISAYFWNGPKFLSVVIYTCKSFDQDKAVEVTKEFWQIPGEIETMAF